MASRHRLLPLQPGRRTLRLPIRPLVGLATVLAIALVIALSLALFAGMFTPAVGVTVMSPRAGLVMNPDAKVKMRGVQVGSVRSIEALPDGTAAIHLDIDPSLIGMIPSNVAVDVASTTVFGAKFVQLVAPPNPSAEPLRAGQVVTAEHVTVEVNTVFEQLTSVLTTIKPEELNKTLSALSEALGGRGEQMGQTISNLNAFLAQLDPSLPSLQHDLGVAPVALDSFADATPDLLRLLDNTSDISQTVVDQQANLDSLLSSLIGLADVGNDVLATNREKLSELLRLLAPLTELTSQYHQALYCGLAAMVVNSQTPPLKRPGAEVLTGFQWGAERYRFPGDLPKVAASGGPQCTGLPNLPFETRAPFVIADVGANPWKYGNEGLVLNSDGIKQLLFGPIDGPPRNVFQVGQPG